MNTPGVGARNKLMRQKKVDGSYVSLASPSPHLERHTVTPGLGIGKDDTALPVSMCGNVTVRKQSLFLSRGKSQEPGSGRKEASVGNRIRSSIWQTVVENTQKLVEWISPSRGSREVRENGEVEVFNTSVVACGPASMFTETLVTCQGEASKSRDGCNDTVVIPEAESESLVATLDIDLHTQMSGSQSVIQETQLEAISEESHDSLSVASIIFTGLSCENTYKQHDDQVGSSLTVGYASCHPVEPAPSPVESPPCPAITTPDGMDGPFLVEGVENDYNKLCNTTHTPHYVLNGQENIGNIENSNISISHISKSPRCVDSSLPSGKAHDDTLSPPHVTPALTVRKCRGLQSTAKRQPITGVFSSSDSSLSSIPHSPSLSPPPVDGGSSGDDEEVIKRSRKYRGHRILESSDSDTGVRDTNLDSSRGNSHQEICNGSSKPRVKKSNNHRKKNSFIVSDDDDSDSNSGSPEVVRPRTNHRKLQPKHLTTGADLSDTGDSASENRGGTARIAKTKYHRRGALVGPVLKPRNLNQVFLSSDSDDDCLVISSDDDHDYNVRGKKPVAGRTKPIPVSKPVPSKTPQPVRVTCDATPSTRLGRHLSTLSFLASLKPGVNRDQIHPDAIRFVHNFKQHRESLVQQLFDLFNKSVFESKLPSDLNITWNVRLSKTAGYCYTRRDIKHGIKNTARIELSTKVCDSADRVRDTLIHELCHAAAWIINGYKDGHGPLWTCWATKARSKHPELSVITRCHSYTINTKFVYECRTCGNQVGRHSKSIDVSKKVCGICHGGFQLKVRGRAGSSNPSSTTPARTPNKFALFVKENYASVKVQSGNVKHGEVMKILSTNFSKLKC